MHVSRVPLIFVAAVVVAVSGCRFGEATFTSTVNGRAFDPAGTVFSYVDEHDANLVTEPNPRVVVAMTWIIFDPNSDLNDLEGSALADYSHELKLRDALSLVFDQQSNVSDGGDFKSVVVGGEEQGDGALRTELHLAPERLSGASTYGDVVPFASQRTTDVALTATDFTAAAPVLNGTITVTFERSTTDPGDARAGVFSGSFLAPLVGERSAEANLALLDVQDVMGLPLAARPPVLAP